jgi:TFIIF-interacting CTD phosphatase-like protein
MIKYVVLDLDECLIHSHVDADTYTTCMENKEYIRVRRHVHLIRTDIIPDMTCITRPHLREFLLFLQNKYRVVIWSAGMYEYVHEVVRIIFQDLPQPEMVLTRNDVTYFDPQKRREYHKPLTTFFGKMPDANVENTVILDDSVINFHSNPANGIVIPRYLPTLYDILHYEDNNLLYAAKWLESHDQQKPSELSRITKKVVPVENCEVVIDYPFARYAAVV